ncbi:MAG TPA: hypothetical protein VIK72_10715 [Clostridiaceae bacterium]
MKLSNFIKSSKFIKISIYGVMICSLVILLALYLNLPSYNLGAGILSYKDKKYMSENSEFKLEPLKLGKIIGKLGRKFIYTIKDNDNYIVAQEILGPTLVYRKANFSPVYYINLKISSIKIENEKFFSSSIVSTNKAIIDDLLASLKDPIKQDSAPSEIITKLKVYLHSEALKGLDYYVYVKLDKYNKVFIDEIGDKGELFLNIPAGPKFSLWINNTKKN